MYVPVECPWGTGSCTWLIVLWLFISISNRMSLILFSAIVLDLRSNVTSFSETYLENEHCSLIGTGWGWGRVVSRSTSTQVDRKFSFLASMDFLTFLLILEVGSKISEHVGEADEIDSWSNSSYISFSNSWSGHRLSLLLPACITGRRNCSLS